MGQYPGGFMQHFFLTALQRSAQMPLPLDPVPELLTSRSSCGMLGTSCNAAAWLHQTNLATEPATPRAGLKEDAGSIFMQG